MVSRAVVLDSGPLGLVTNPRPSPQNLACSDWMQALIEAGITVVIPEIADYEIRRELVRAQKVRGLAMLDALCESLMYLPLSTGMMRSAAELWAEARNMGKQTADDLALDGDVILAAQSLSLRRFEVVVATTNVGHLSRFVAAESWTLIDSNFVFQRKPR